MNKLNQFQITFYINAFERANYVIETALVVHTIAYYDIVETPTCIGFMHLPPYMIMILPPITFETRPQSLRNNYQDINVLDSSLMMTADNRIAGEKYSPIRSR